MPTVVKQNKFLKMPKLQIEDDANQAALKAEEDKAASASAIVQQQADTEAYAAEQRAASQERQQQIQAQQQRLDWERAHPERAYAAPQETQYDEGAGEGEAAMTAQDAQTLSELQEENARWAAMNDGEY